MDDSIWMKVHLASDSNCKIATFIMSNKYFYKGIPHNVSLCVVLVTLHEWFTIHVKQDI